MTNGGLLLYDVVGLYVVNHNISNVYDTLSRQTTSPSLSGGTVFLFSVLYHTFTQFFLHVI